MEFTDAVKTAYDVAFFNPAGDVLDDTKLGAELSPDTFEVRSTPTMRR